VWIPFALLFIYYLILACTWRPFSEEGVILVVCTLPPLLIVMTTIVVQWLRYGFRPRCWIWFRFLFGYDSGFSFGFGFGFGVGVGFGFESVLILSHSIHS
jgi:hypothetical protein